MKASPELSGRAWQLIAVAALIVSLLGYFAGTRRSGRGAPAPPQSPSAALRRAPSYGELRQQNHGPNAGMYGAGFEELTPGDDPYASIEQTDEQRREALRARAERRAYDGAPPVVPHAVDQRAFPDCLSCHQQGARVAGKVAPRMSHERYDSCTQCHVVMNTPLPGGVDETVETSFEGLAGPERGERAWTGAPPTIPHSTWMRSRCTSCHGTSGRLGMRSSHPYRQSCTQCHAPSAELDRAPAADQLQAVAP